MATNIVDLGNNTFGGPTGGVSIVPVSIAAGTTNGAAIDCINAVLPLNGRLLTGVFTSPGTLIVKFQEAIEDPASLGNPLSSDWSDISGAVFTTVAVTGVAPIGAQTILIKNMGTTSGVPYKRFIRAVATVAGGGASIICAVEVFAQKRVTGTGGGYSVSPAV
jgi:hypothetical protein